MVGVIYYIAGAIVALVILFVTLYIREKLKQRKFHKDWNELADLLEDSTGWPKKE